jgi:hypothetical protein
VMAPKTALYVPGKHSLYTARPHTYSLMSGWHWRFYDNQPTNRQHLHIGDSFDTAS